MRFDTTLPAPRRPDLNGSRPGAPCRESLSSWRFLRPCVILFLVFAFTACAKAPVVVPPVEAPKGLVRLEPIDFPSFTDDMHADGLATAIEASLAYLRRVPDALFRFGPDTYSAGHMVKSLEAVDALIKRRMDPVALQDTIVRDFAVYRSSGEPDSGQVLFTGYYEPVLSGCERQRPDCPYPVYGRPSDLISIDLGLFNPKFQGEKLIGRWTGRTLVPYHDRSEIDGQGKLTGKAPVLAWAKDPIDLFFLHIQGSGRLRLDTGKTLVLNYDGVNGQPYRSIGKLLIDQGKIPAEQMSMQAIRAYLQRHPDQIATVFNTNPSYVFFKTAADGPKGALDVKLTAGRSLATDLAIFPRAALVYIQAQKPLLGGTGNISAWVPFNRFVLNQDTGGAIRGPGRADIFWGGGPYAETAAGHLKHRGMMYFLVLKPEVAISK